ncbi:acyl-CoA dehydrogenase family protein [Nocardioides marmoribigeumensis]|uniref:Acyl-CoA dehydrogenase n=1 Tax=Nocardioides marmoribigeumensis TaxID=433649 RepID=A0ABU2BXY5_9ACTN|nr:acyl-CoA dehydrogenase family protein [Nocardioides marmoribigeumensis]MDR7363249.1 acyl-CoA dehydrogenase [Nocardioides marmoribigeumensis]
MILTDTEDLEALRKVTRDFESTVSAHDVIEREARVDRALWERACRELGVAAVGVPEAYGGLGLGPAGIAVVLEEGGRVLVPLPLLGSMVHAQELLVASGDHALLEEVVPGLLSGQVVAAVADREGLTPASAVRSGEGWLLSGTKAAVLDGMSADLLLVVAATDAGPSLFLVDAADVSREAAESLDLTRDFARVSLDAAPGRLVGDWASLSTAVAPTLTLAVAAEAVGSAEACLEASVSYAKTRVQFGREIGSFQAVKHLLAEVAVRIDDARSALDHAMWAATHHPEEAALTASMAAVTATTAQLRATADNIQVHGGIGFTWEHTAHLHFRRARSNAALFGDVRHHHENVLSALGL